MIDRSATRAHPDDLVDPARSPERRRVVTVNLAESPLAWLHARGHLSERQFRAGERLRADFERAGLSPSITMRWMVRRRRAVRAGRPVMARPAWRRSMPTAGSMRQ